MTLHGKIWRTAKDLQARLAVDYPFLFHKDAPLPLKLGIAKDIAARYGATRRVVEKMLNWWCGRRAYLYALAEGAARHGFDGPDGTVTRDQSELARAYFARRMAKSKDDGWTARMAERERATA